MSGHDHDRARAALYSIPPDLPHSDWVRAGMAAHAAGLGFDDFDAWSAGGDSYDKRVARSTWHSFKHGKGITEGTLFHLAQEHGGHAFRAKAPAAIQHRAVKPSRRTLSAVEVWQRCEPATDSHAYIKSKNGRTDGLRVVPVDDPLRVSGSSVAGWLVVPVIPLAGGEPSSLQFIPPPATAQQVKAKNRPTKPNLPGATMNGAFVVGELLAGGTAYVCEGIGQAWACWQATGHAGVVCFGWSRVRAIAAELRQRDASAQLVLVLDVGKEEVGASIAQEVGAAVVRMPEGEADNFDANDLAKREGADVLAALLERASEPPKPALRYQLLGSAALRQLPPLVWRVRGVLPAHGLASVYGPSSSGKSFLALDAAAAIAEGSPWFGYRVKQAPVVYCALEGEAGFRLRVAAWEQAKGRTLPTELHIVLQAFKLTEPQDVDDLAAAILTAGQGAVTILDTLNRAAPEADENASADMGRILEAAKRLQGLTCGLVVVVHHSGKDATKGLRGHSSLFAALDAALEVSREGDRKEWKVAKAKDGQDGALHSFRLGVVELGIDEEGEPITSCAIELDDSPKDATRSNLPKGGNQKVVLLALGELLRQSVTFGMAGAPNVRPCVEVEASVEAIAPRIMCEPKRQKERVRLALTGLHAAGVVTCREGWLWLP